MNNSILEESWGNLRNAVIGSSAALVFGVVILLMSFLAVANPLRVFPAGVPLMMTEKVQYYLPYPGILPDNPAYRLKAFRDAVRLWLTPDGESKGQLALELADKRLGAAIALIEGGQLELGTSTATKAEKYLLLAVDQSAEQVRQGKDVKSLLLTLQKATAKHAEVLTGLLAKLSGDNRMVVERTLQETQILIERTNQAFRDSK